MARGYAEGPAIEEALDALEGGRDTPEQPPDRPAVYGATKDNPEKHFIGWLGEVDPDKLFASGKAWGISIVRKRA